MKSIANLAAGAAVAFLIVGLTGSPGPSHASQPVRTPTEEGVATGIVNPAAVIQRAGPADYLPEDTECLRFGPDGYEQLWSGEETNELVAMSDALQDIADFNRDSVAGTALCASRDGAAIFVAHPNEELTAQIAAVAAAYPSLTVATEAAAAGADPAMDAALQLTRETEYGAAITAAGVDVYTGGLIISANPEADEVAGSAVTAESLHAAVLALTGLDLPIALQAAGPYEAATRLNDAAPWKMGSAINHAIRES